MKLNCDAEKIRNYAITPEGFATVWAVIGRANYDLVYNVDGKQIVEFINRDNLFKPETINSAIGKHAAYHHPPQAINAANWRKYSIGTILQQVEQDGDNLVMPVVVYEPEIVKGIVDGKIVNTSCGYTAPKAPPNQDGKIEQLGRVVNHISFGGEEFIARAGASSKILIMNDGESANNSTTTENNNQESANNPTFGIKPLINEQQTKILEPKKIQMDIGELVKLYKEWEEVLIENGKTIDYNSDSSALKKQILSCFYPEAEINKFSGEGLHGFWTHFQLQKDSIVEMQQTRRQPESSVNIDSGSAREAYIKLMTGAK